MAYEALYRRYRPSRFDNAFFGQTHIVSALRNAVDGDRVGHAYLFSGPRGTGKTTSARILAKALNCTNLQGGEPCDECDSCESFKTNSSYDLHELDAASNNGVEAMRDLISKVALGSPGRTKVYILDEVHMLSSGAENALLKTLEEPPPHVVFVLCTTEPNKVVPTIRSRTQHLEFSLLNVDDTNALIDYVVADAGIELSADDRAYVVRAGGGSARDTLSALDQVIAAGGAPDVAAHLDALMGALGSRDGAAALLATDAAVQAGRDPGVIAAALLHDLRGAFLIKMRADVGHLADGERTTAEQTAAAMSPAQITRAIEVIGSAIIDMRQAPDPRVDLEVALIRITRPDLDTSAEAMLERIERLEQGAPVAPRPASPAAAPAEPPPVEQRPPAAESPAAAARAAVAEPVAQTAPAPAPEPAAPAAEQSPAPVNPPPRSGSGPDRVRAALAEMDNKRGAAAPAAAAAAGAVAGRSLADARRERREGEGAPQETPPVPTASEPAGEPAPAETQPPMQPPEATPAAEPASPIEPVPVGEPTMAAAEPLPPTEAGPDVEPSIAAIEPEPAPASDASTAAPAGGQVDTETIDAAWNAGILESLSGKVRSRFIAGQFVPSDDGTAHFALPNPVHRDRCDEVRAEVDAALAAHFGHPIALTLVVDTAEDESPIFDAADSDRGAAASGERQYEPEEAIDPAELVDAEDAVTGVDRLLQTFEGSRIVEEDPQ